MFLVFAVSTVCDLFLFSTIAALDGMGIHTFAGICTQSRVSWIFDSRDFGIVRGSAQDCANANGAFLFEIVQRVFTKTQVSQFS